jgi:hypothetical protein
MRGEADAPRGADGIEDLGRDGRHGEVSQSTAGSRVKQAMSIEPSTLNIER